MNDSTKLSAAASLLDIR